MIEVTAHIGVLYVDILLPGCQSLKDKRMVLKRLKHQIRNEFNVSVGELDAQDKWQRATLGISMIGGDNRYIDSAMQNILSFIDRFHLVEVCDHHIEFC